MTVHIDLSKSEATLAEVIDLARGGETIVIDREGERLGELTFAPLAPSSEAEHPSIDSEFDDLLARAKAKHPFIGAFAHLGPIPEGDAANTFDEPDLELERLVSESDDDWYR